VLVFLTLKVRVWNHKLFRVLTSYRTRWHYLCGK